MLDSKKRRAHQDREARAVQLCYRSVAWKKPNLLPRPCNHKLLRSEWPEWGKSTRVSLFYGSPILVLLKGSQKESIAFWRIPLKKRTHNHISLPALHVSSTKQDLPLKTSLACSHAQTGPFSNLSSNPRRTSHLRWANQSGPKSDSSPKKWPPKSGTWLNQKFSRREHLTS